MAAGSEETGRLRHVPRPPPVPPGGCTAPQRLSPGAKHPRPPELLEARGPLPNQVRSPGHPGARKQISNVDGNAKSGTRA